MAHPGADGAVPVQPNIPADPAAPDPNEVTTRELLQTLVERDESGMGHSVEIFCGYPQESIDLWLNRMERHLALKGVPEDRKIRTAMTYTRGPCELFLMRSELDEIEDWEAFKALLRNEYMSQTSMLEIEEKLDNCKLVSPHKTEAFIQEVLELSLKSGADDNQTMRSLIKGLNPKVKAYVLLQKPANLNQTLAAIRLSAVINDGESKASTPVEFVSQVKDEKDKIIERVVKQRDNFKDKLSAATAHVRMLQEGRLQNQNQANFTSSYEQQSPESYELPEFGMIPNQQYNNSWGTGTKRCYRCREVGHFIKNCPQPEDPARSRRFEQYNEVRDMMISMMLECIEQMQEWPYQPQPESRYRPPH